jgi:hypothetical protein
MCGRFVLYTAIVVRQVRKAINGHYLVVTVAQGFYSAAAGSVRRHCSDSQCAIL